jgi:hypothetical protein
MTDVGDERLCCEECGGGHEVSIPIGVGADVGRYGGSQPRANISMTIIRPPQRGQERAPSAVFGGARISKGTV